MYMVLLSGLFTMIYVNAERRFDKKKRFTLHPATEVA